MPGERILWTGSYGSGVLEQALASASHDPSSVWLVDSPLARDQLRRELARERLGPRVWCWSDLWARVRIEGGAGPICLSEAAADAVFAEAIRRAREQRELDAVSAVIDWPGYRRRLRRRFVDWTVAERPLRSAAPTDPVVASEWAAFLRYRGILGELGAEDDAGLAAWASKRLSRRPPASLAKFDQVTFLGWEAPAQAHWRVLDFVLRRGRSVRVTMPFEADAGSAPVYEAVAPVRDRLLRLGFVESSILPDLWRPAGLRVLEESLFRGAGTQGRLHDAPGLSIRGAPQGDGAARMVARAVREHLDRGVHPQEILVLFPRWGEQAEITLDLLRSWDIPAHAAPHRPLGSDPGVAALLLAIGLPGEDWSTDRLIQLLRHGRLRPSWPGADPDSLAEAASVIKTSPVFRGREQLLRWLDRTVATGRGETVQGRRAGVAGDLVERLFAVLGPLDRPRPFAAQVDRLFQIAGELGIDGVDTDSTPSGDSDQDTGLDRLREALEDRAGVIGRLERADEPWSWVDFAHEVESSAMGQVAPAAAPPLGAVRLATVGEGAGARAAHVILADLAEGEFPAREAVEKFLEIRPGAPADADARRASSREMLRFLRVIGSAGSSLTLVYPTTDAKGQELLRAGFLDELIEILTPEAIEGCHRAVRRLDPALLDAPELAGSPSDKRVRAFALARARGEGAELRGLLRRAGHRGALDGAAAALQLLARRLRGSPFGEYDGLLRDGDIILDVAEMFPPEFLFSASQLETYIGCPFQFFCKYVLKLEPAERRDEIDEDYTERGSKIHDMLQALEEMKRDGGEPLDLDELERAALNSVLLPEEVEPSEVDLGLREIDRRRLVQTLQFYRAQHERYERGPSGRRVTGRFEVTFGEESSGHPFLQIGQGSRAVRIQGKIDRIDIVDGPEGPGFRVIDYKSGHGPSASEVRQARMVQLPLYAMAVERIILAGEGLALRDVGYWALRKEGYKPIAFEAWPEAQAAIEAYLAEIVERLRGGVFVVDSQIDGCEGFCDFRAICRIRQARQAAKRHDRPIPPELLLERARSSGRGRRGQGSRTAAASSPAGDGGGS